MKQLDLFEWCQDAGIGLMHVPDIPAEEPEEIEKPGEEIENRCNDCLYFRNEECKCYMTVDDWPEWQQWTDECRGFTLKDFNLKSKYKKKGRWDK